MERVGRYRFGLDKLSLGNLLGGIGVGINSYEAQIQAQQKLALGRLDMQRQQLEYQHMQQQAAIDVANAKLDGAQFMAKQAEQNAPDPAMQPYQVKPMGGGGPAPQQGGGMIPGAQPMQQPPQQGGGNPLLGGLSPAALAGPGGARGPAPGGNGGILARGMGSDPMGGAPQGQGGDAPPQPPSQQAIMQGLLQQAQRAGLDPSSPQVAMAIRQRVPQAMAAAVEQWKNQNEVYKEKQAEKDRLAARQDREQFHEDTEADRAATRAATAQAHADSIGLRSAELSASQKSKGWELFQSKDGTLLRVNKDSGEVAKVAGDDTKNLQKVGGSGGQPRSAAAMAAKKFMEENPNATAADIQKFASQGVARSAAMRSLQAGPIGNKITSFNAAADHLQTLRGLVKAFGAGDEATIATAKAAYEREFGNPAPTNIQAAVALVGPEVLKAVEGGPGGVSEREGIGRLLAQKTTSGALGAIDTVSGLIGGQINATRKQVVDNDKLVSSDEFENMLTAGARSAFEKHSAAAGGPSTTPPNTPMAVNPQTGHKVMWNGKAWVDAPGQ